MCDRSHRGQGVSRGGEGRLSFWLGATRCLRGCTRRMSRWGGKLRAAGGDQCLQPYQAYEQVGREAEGGRG